MNPRLRSAALGGALAGAALGCGLGVAMAPELCLQHGWPLGETSTVTLCALGLGLIGTSAAMTVTATGSLPAAWGVCGGAVGGIAGFWPGVVMGDAASEAAGLRRGEFELAAIVFHWLAFAMLFGVAFMWLASARRQSRGCDGNHADGAPVGLRVNRIALLVGVPLASAAITIAVAFAWHNVVVPAIFLVTGIPPMRGYRSGFLLLLFTHAAVAAVGAGAAGLGARGSTYYRIFCAVGCGAIGFYAYWAMFIAAKNSLGFDP